MQLVVPYFRRQCTLDDRHKAIWRLAAAQAGATLTFLPCLDSHAATFRASSEHALAAAAKGPDEILFVAELDFLPRPTLRAWFESVSVVSPDRLWAPNYCAVAPNMVRREYPAPGLWFFGGLQRTIAAERRLDFGPGGPFNDPGYNLPRERTQCIGGREFQRKGSGFTWAVEYANLGAHLFWSRHYCDDPKKVVWGRLTAADIVAEAERVTTEIEKEWRE